MRNYSVDDTGPRHASFNKQAMQSTSLGEALGMQAGNLHVRLASSARVQRSSSTPFVPSPLGTLHGFHEMQPRGTREEPEIHLA